MAITKQQAQAELIRRRSMQPAVKIPQQPTLKAPTANVTAKSAQAELARRELVKRGQMQQKPTGMKGFVQNAATDFSSFGKGMLGVGRELITHPVYNAGKVLGVGGEIAKGIPNALGSIAHDVVNFGDTTQKGIEAWRQLSQIPLDKQKEMLSRDIKKISESNGNDNQKKLAEIGAGILGHYSQYSRPGEKIYNEPFSAALDILPVLKGVGAGKLAAKGGQVLNKIPAVAKTTEAVSDAFVPMGKLKRLGYGKVAEDLANTTSNIRTAQEGIIRSTVKKFEKDFKLNKAEKTQFFDAIDVGRRDASYIPTSPNPKVQQAIDWYMKEELPRIKKISGIEKQRAGVKEGLTKQLQEMQLRQVRQSIIPTKTKKPKTTLEKIENITGIKKPRQIKSGLKEGMYVKNIDRNNVGRIVSIDNERGVANVFFENKKNRTKAAVNISLEKLAPTSNSRKLAGEALKGKISETEKILQDYKNNPQGIQNYLHHFFNPTNETNFGGKLSTPSRGFLKQSKDVEGFVKDPIVSIAGVKSKAATANIKQGFVDRIMKKYSKPAEMVTEFKGGKIIDQATGDELMKYKGGFLPKDLGEELTRIEKGEPGWLKTVLAPARTFNANWKPLATAVRPRYHLRNIVGNVYNASFVGGAGLQRYPQALFQQMKNHIATQMSEGTLAGKVYKSFFKEAPEHKYIQMATKDGVIGKGFFSVDINDMADVANTVEDFSKYIAKMDSPALVYKIPVLKQWMNTMQSFGSAIEDNARLALYIDQLKKGSSRINATKYVNKHLFDYMNGLGEADKAIKAIIPFWSWRRFNVPLQFGALAKNPLRHLLVQEGGKPFVQQNEANNPEYKYLSQREKDMGAIKTGETAKDGKVSDIYMRTQGVLPIQDIMGVTDPSNIGMSPIFDMLSQGYNLVNPPENPQANLDYFGRPVESFPGEVKRFLGVPVRGTGKEILQSVPALSELNKLIGGSYDSQSMPNSKARLQTVFSPTSSSIQDREKNRQYFESDYARKYGVGTMQPGYLSELKYVSKKLVENPNDSVSRTNFKTLVNLMKQGGMKDSDIQTEIMKSLQAAIKKENPKEKKPGSLRPKRPTPLLDPYYANDVQQQIKKLNPFFTK